MKGGEHKFWTLDLRTGMNSIGHTNRIESHAATIGRPDVNICLHGGIVWDIELKYCDHNKVELRPAQRMWLKRRATVGGNCAVLTKVVGASGTFFLWNLSWPDGNKLEEWIAMADHCMEDKIDIAQLEELLRAQK